MQFRTEISIIPTDKPIDYSSNIVLLGSCFSDHIGEKLSFYKFQSISNPFGLLFHPLALEKLISKAIEKRKVEEKECIAHQGLWHHLDFHSDMSNGDKSALVSNINNGLDSLTIALKSASHICITLGTAWAYTHLASNSIVANCHKIPQSEFSKRLLTLKEISHSLNEIIKNIKSTNKEAQIIFTLSPVRHLKDGFIENQLSKAHLLTALHQFIENKQIHYFPAYEIMLDDLRDYRFYKSDMIHPNAQAIDYIWNKFKSGWIDPRANNFMKRIETIQQGLAHRPFHPEGNGHQQFLQKLNAQILALKKEIPHLNF